MQIDESRIRDGDGIDDDPEVRVIAACFPDASAREVMPFIKDLKDAEKWEEYGEDAREYIRMNR